MHSSLFDHQQALVARLRHQPMQPDQSSEISGGWGLVSRFICEATRSLSLSCARFFSHSLYVGVCNTTVSHFVRFQALVARLRHQPMQPNQPSEIDLLREKALAKREVFPHPL